MTKGERSFVLFSIGPTMFMMLTLVAGPILYSLYISFHEWNLMQPAVIGTFAGLGNYVGAFTSPIFAKSLQVTLVFVLSTVMLEMLLGIGIALMINQIGRIKALLLAILIIPWAIPNVVNGLMWKWILNPHYGLLNGLLYSLGLIQEYLSLLSRPVIAMMAIINAQIWKQLPLVVFILFAGLQSIPNEIFEAAIVDGASTIKKFCYITLPYLYPPLTVMLVLQTMESLRTFDTIWIMTGGGPGTATSVIAWLTYNAAFREFDFGEGAAFSFLITFLTLAFATIYIRLFRTSR